MLAQKKISSFFKNPSSAASSMKRVVKHDSSDEGDAKKLKCVTPEKQDKVDHESGGDSLSPAQKLQIEDKRLQAIILKKSKELGALSSNIGITWYKALEPEFSKPYFKQLSSFIVEERKKHTIFPPEDKIYTWTKVCTIQEVKVVILGQDPYHDVNQAHGLCFSVLKGTAPPPSLVNMYKELKNDIDNFEIPKHGDLTGWAEQGVLLLNAVLTVRAHNANSHKDKGWEKLTDSVIICLSKSMNNIVFLLWGAYAQKKEALIDKSKHCILKTVHPSPLSAHKGFFGCKHFSQANEYLKKHNRKPIDWSKLN